MKVKKLKWMAVIYELLFNSDFTDEDYTHIKNYIIRYKQEKI